LRNSIRALSFHWPPYHFLEDQITPLRILACVPGWPLERWLIQTVGSRASLELCESSSLVSMLANQTYGGALILLSRPMLRSWARVRNRLVETSTPTILLSPLTVETLHALAFERELRLVALHVLGFEDSPAHLQASLERLLSDSILRRFLSRFGAQAQNLESLILPCWSSLAEIRSLEAWATLLHREQETLVRQLHDCGVRSPRRLLTWLRLLSAWPMLHAGRAAGRVSLEVGYGAPPAFTRSTRQFVGIPPSSASKVPMESLIESAATDLVA
jgi:AraC-like DNA-binding protein